MKKLLLLTFILNSFAVFAARDKKSVDSLYCYQAYRTQASKDLVTIADDSDILSYQGRVERHSWSSTRGYTSSSTDYFSIDRGKLGAGIGFVSLFGIGIAGAPISINLPFTLGIFGGAVAQIAIETANAARRLKTYSIISTSMKCVEENSCDLDADTVMGELLEKAKKEGFDGSMTDMALKVTKSLSKLCTEVSVYDRKGNFKRSKINKTYGLNKLAKVLSLE